MSNYLERLVAEYDEEELEERAYEYWDKRVRDKGVPATWPEMVKETGTPLRALKLLAKSTRGIYLGESWDPRDRKWKSAIVPSGVSKVDIASPMQGKTNKFQIPGVLQDLAGDNQVVFVTPQPKAIHDLAPGANALVGEGGMTTVDFGGDTVSHNSPAFVAYDPTKACKDPDRAREFAMAIGGPESPLAKDLDDGGGLWSGIISPALTVYAHLTGAERAAKGLAPGRDNGMTRIINYATLPKPGEIPEKLSPEMRAGMVRRGGKELAEEMEETVRRAHQFATRYHPRLHKAAYDMAMHTWRLQRVADDRGIPRAKMKEAGLPVLDPTATVALLDELDHNLTRLDARSADASGMLVRSMRNNLPDHEIRTMTPTKGGLEFSPEEFVEKGSGLLVVTYKLGRHTGQGPGLLTDAVINAAFEQNALLEAERRIAEAQGQRVRPQRGGGKRVYIDEGTAAAYTDATTGMQTGRQRDVAINLSSTSDDSVSVILGELEAKATLGGDAPIVIKHTPRIGEAETIAKGFGQEVGQDDTVETKSGSAEFEVKTSYPMEDIVTAANVLDKEMGDAVMHDPTSKGRRLSFISPPPWYERGNPVGEAVAQAKREGYPGLPTEQLRPDALASLRAKQAAELRAKEKVFRPPTEPAEPRHELEEPAAPAIKPTDEPAQIEERPPATPDLVAGRPEAEPVEAPRPPDVDERRTELSPPSDGVDDLDDI